MMLKNVDGVVVEMTAEEEAEFLAQCAKAQQDFMQHLAASIRSDRNRLLAESDWTVNPEIEIDKAAWVVYRQALRDLPMQPGFPENIIWPTPPT